MVAAGDEGELLGLQGVEGDIDPVETCFYEALQVLLQQKAVGGHGHVLEAEVLEPADKLHHAPAHQGFAAGYADFRHAELEAGFGEGEHLFEGQDLALILELDVFGHAVLAAEVAAVGYRDPQVVHLTVVRVLELNRGFLLHLHT